MGSDHELSINVLDMLLQASGDSKNTLSKLPLQPKKSCHWNSNGTPLEFHFWFLAGNHIHSGRELWTLDIGIDPDHSNTTGIQENNWKAGIPKQQDGIPWTKKSRHPDDSDHSNATVRIDSNLQSP